MQCASGAARHDPKYDSRHANVSSESNVTVFSIVLANRALQGNQRQSSQERRKQHSTAHRSDSHLRKQFIATLVQISKQERTKDDGHQDHSASGSDRHVNVIFGYFFMFGPTCALIGCLVHVNVLEWLSQLLGFEGSIFLHRPDSETDRHSSSRHARNLEKRAFEGRISGAQDCSRRKKQRQQKVRAIGARTLPLARPAHVGGLQEVLMRLLQLEGEEPCLVWLDLASPFAGHSSRENREAIF